MALETLHDVLVDNLKDLLHAEKQLVRSLPKMSKAATDERLKEAIDEHLEITKNQVTRLEEIFSAIGETAKPKKCPAMEGLIEEGEEIIGEKKGSTPAALDAALIAAAQRVEHYEISGYGSARTFAEVLGFEDAARMLQETLDEESEANEKLNELAQEINSLAAEGAEEEEEHEEEDEEKDEPVARGSSRTQGSSRSGNSGRSSGGRQRETSRSR